MSRLKPKIPAFIAMVLSLSSLSMYIYSDICTGSGPWVLGIMLSMCSFPFYLIDAVILIYHTITTKSKGIHIPLIAIITGSIVVFSIFGQRGDTISTLVWCLYCTLLIILEIFSIRAVVMCHS